MRARRALASAAATVACAAGIAACGGGATSTVPRHPDTKQWLSFDAAKRTASIKLVIAYNERVSGFNIDGGFKGALLFSVPAGWRIVFDCVNHSSRRYACVVAHSPRSPKGTAGVDVLHPPAGLAPGASSSFTFSSRSPGLYRLAAVAGTPPSQQPAGMWIVLKCSDPSEPRGRTPYARWLR